MILIRLVLEFCLFSKAIIPLRLRVSLAFKLCVNLLFNSGIQQPYQIHSRLYHLSTVQDLCAFQVKIIKFNLIDKQYSILLMITVDKIPILFTWID